MPSMSSSWPAVLALLVACQPTPTPDVATVPTAQSTASAMEPPSPDQGPEPADQGPEPVTATPADLLQGTWKLVQKQHRGKPVPAEQVAASETTLSFTNDRATLRFVEEKSKKPQEEAYTVRLEEGGGGHADFATAGGTVYFALYRLDGDRLEMCMETRSGQPRPADMSCPESELWVFARQP